MSFRVAKLENSSNGHRIVQGLLGNLNVLPPIEEAPESLGPSLQPLCFCFELEDHALVLSFVLEY